MIAHTFAFKANGLRKLYILKTHRWAVRSVVSKKANQIRPDLEQIRVGNRMFALRDIGPLTRETRNRRGETLKNVAEHLALSIAGLSRIETGQHLPNGALLTRLLRYVFPNTVVHFTDQDVGANYQHAGFRTLLENLLEQEGLPHDDRMYVANMVEAFMAYRRPQLLAGQTEELGIEQ
jgi:transcriptional regulator with XRE-family HTH domain